METLTLQCSNLECMTRLRLGRVLKEPITNNVQIRYCPKCGQFANALVDDTEDYWERLAVAYKVNVDAVKLLHSAWNPKVTPLFSDFLRETLVELKAS